MNYIYLNLGWSVVISLTLQFMIIMDMFNEVSNVVAIFVVAMIGYPGRIILDVVVLNDRHYDIKMLLFAFVGSLIFSFVLIPLWVVIYALPIYHSKSNEWWITLFFWTKLFIDVILIIRMVADQSVIFYIFYWLMPVSGQ